MDAETKTALLEMGFTEADVAELAPKFEGKEITKTKGYLRQGDYSRKMNDLQKSEQALKDANDALNTELADWASVQSSGKQATQQQREALEKAQGDVLRLQQVVTRVATDAGLDPAEVLKGTAVATPPKAPETPTVDMSGYVKVEDLHKALGPLASGILDLPAELHQIAQEHHTLTGKYLDVRAIAKEIKDRASTRNNQKTLDPRGVWEEMNNIPTLRQEKSDAERAAEIKAAEDRGAERALTQMSVPGAHTVPGRQAPVFRTPAGDARKSAVSAPQPGSRLQGAVAALRSGKYRADNKPGA